MLSKRGKVKLWRMQPIMLPARRCLALTVRQHDITLARAAMIELRGD